MTQSTHATANRLRRDVERLALPSGRAVSTPGHAHPQAQLVARLGVGARATERADHVLTLDPDRYRSAFANLRVEPIPDPRPNPAPSG